MGRVSFVSCHASLVCRDDEPASAVERAAAVAASRPIYVIMYMHEVISVSLTMENERCKL